MRKLRLIATFFRVSLQTEAAYRSNFWIHIFHALLNLGIGILGVIILFRNIPALNGWNYSAMIALLGVYQILGAIRNLCFGPSLEALAGMGREIWNGEFDFILLRPLQPQFLSAFRRWNPFAIFDLLLGAGVLTWAACLSGKEIPILQWVGFFLALAAAGVTLYAVLIIFTALVFWSPDFMFTWLFDSLFQTARFPVQIYPAGLRFILTWIIPVGLMTTIPAQAFSGQLSLGTLLTALAAAAILLILASWLFRLGIRRYSSASS